MQNFRYERPQKGRLRQHFQFGIEAFGIDDPLIDVEIISFANDFFKTLGLSDYSLSINSLGDSNAREKHMSELQEYFSKYSSDFDDEFKARLEKNPLRILDTKDQKWMDMVNGAPQILDFLSNESIADFEIVKNSLTDLLSLIHI